MHNPIIAAGSTQTRGSTAVAVVKQSDIVPPSAYSTTVDGVLTSVSQLPEKEGQMVFVPSTETGFCIGYVVVDLNRGEGDPVLRWRTVSQHGNIIDYRTGKKWDPMFNLYG